MKARDAHPRQFIQPQSTTTPKEGIVGRNSLRSLGFARGEAMERPMSDPNNPQPTPDDPNPAPARPPIPPETPEPDLPPGVPSPTPDPVPTPGEPIGIPPDNPPEIPPMPGGPGVGPTA